MATLSLTLYRYAVEGSRVTAVDGPQTLSAEDADGKGLLGPRALAGVLLGDDGDQALWGADGDDPARDAVLAVTAEQGTESFTLYTAQGLAVGDRVSLTGLRQNFAPFCPPQPDVVCFAADTPIETASGPVSAGALAIGDLVRTRDDGLQPIRWIGQQRVDGARLALQPNLRPIRIRKGALGAGLPAADLVVSPQHRVLVRSPIAQRIFGTAEVLVAAKQLCQLDGIDIAADLPEVSYVHFMFDRHQIVYSAGAETESMLAGPEAMKSVGAAARAEIMALFPELALGAPPAVRTLASGRMGRKLAVRHVQNRKPLVG